MPEIVLDTNSNRLIRGLGDRALITEMRMQYSAGELLRVHVRKDNLPHEFGVGFQMKFMAKADGGFSGAAIIDVTGFTLDGTSYVATVNTMSEAVATALGIGGGNEVATVEIDGQFAWRAAAEDPWHDCQVIRLHLDNSSRRGDEVNVIVENLFIRKENGAVVFETIGEEEDTGHVFLADGDPPAP